MRQILTVIFLVITIAAFSQGTIAGRVIDSTTKQPLIGAKVTLLTINSIKWDSTYKVNDFLSSEKPKLVYHFDTTWKREKLVYTDSLGYYRIDSVGPNYYYVYSFFQIIEKHGRKIGESDASNSFRLSGSQNRTVDFQLGVFCSYDVTKDLVECPNCHKREGVRIQIYGLPDDIKNALQDDGKHFYNGYCVVTRCQPTKICLICKAEF